MVKIKVKDQEYYMDGILQSNMDRVKKQVKNDWDFVYVVDGEVGAGKSVLAAQIAYYVSEGDFDISRICFTPKEFRDAILKCPRYKAVIFDEAFRGLSSRSAMTETNKMLVSMLQEIRQKNLFVFIVLPSVWDLDKYVSFHRSKGVLHVYTDKKKTRGFFRFYKKNVMRHMLANGRIKYSYPPYPSFKGRFTKFFPVSEKEYKEKKAKSLGDYAYEKEANKKETREEITAKRWKGNYKDLISYTKAKTGLSYNKICKDLGHNYGTVKNIDGNLGTNDVNYLLSKVDSPQNKADLTKQEKSQMVPVDVEPMQPVGIIEEFEIINRPLTQDDMIKDLKELNNKEEGS